MLGGCIKPDYVEQYIETPEHWRMDAYEGSTLCNAQWWKQFEDPVLDELVFVALNNNQDLQLAIYRVLEYYAKFKVVQSELFPFLNGTGGYNRTQLSIALPTAGQVIPSGPNTGFIRRFNDYNGLLNLNWELDFWGQIQNASAAAYADMLSQVEARRAVVVTVVKSVVNGYILLRQLDAQLEVSRQTVASRLESYNLAKDRFHLGETSMLEVIQAEAEMETAIIREIEYERQIPQAENHLSILLGQNPRDIIRGKALNTFTYPFAIPAGLPSDLLRRRPDIVQAEQKLRSANASVAEARTLFFPQFTLTGFYGQESARLRDFLHFPANTWQYGLNFVQPIFNAGQIYYTVQEALAVRDEALFFYKQTILNAFKEVEDSLIATQTNQQLVKEHEKQVEILYVYLRLAKLRYSEGETDYLNVLDAERQLFDTQLQLVQSQADNFNAVVDLYSALGGGWVDDADTAALQKFCE